MAENGDINTVLGNSLSPGKFPFFEAISAPRFRLGCRLLHARPLLTPLSPWADTATRTAAEQQLTQASENNFVRFPTCTP